MKRFFSLSYSLLSIFVFANLLLNAQVVYAGSPDEGAKSALTLQANALLKDDVQESLKYLTTHVGLAIDNKERRSILYYTASIQEQLGRYAEAALTYAEAAGIDEDDARGMPKATNAQLYLFAARSSLEACDFEAADMYLDTLVLNSSKDKDIIATKRLYGAWCTLCKAQNYEESKGIISRLKQFSDEDSMESVRRQILFTLWFVTGENQYAKDLKRKYSSSPEAAVIDGRSEIIGMPFWYFMPRASLEDENFEVSKTAYESTSGSSGDNVSSDLENKNTAVSVSSENVSSDKKTVKSKVRQQLGLFREMENAQKLIDKVKKSGFNAYYYTEVRSSGTSYIIVVVDENAAGTMGDKLKAAGFDCYPVNY